MTHMLDQFGWNLLIAVPIALAVWLMCRTRLLRQRPALCHGLWLLVLLKLVTPPVVPIPVLPAIAAEQKTSSVQHSGPAQLPFSVDNSGDDDSMVAPIISMNEEVNEESEPNLKPSIPDSNNTASSKKMRNELRAFSLQEACICLLGVSLVVSAVICFAAARQLRRVRRLLHGHTAQSGRTGDCVQEVSRKFGLRTAPKLLFIDASITPMLWVELGNSAILLPQQLADSLDDDQLRSVIAHEVAHYVRRDHWANLFAFIVTSLFWWNPIAWFARRAMTNAAEASCDALALERLDRSRKSYAETLLAVVDFVTTNKPLRPTLTVTFGESHSIKRRFELIADANVKSSISRVSWLLLALGATSLFLAPARAQQGSQASPAPAQAKEYKNNNSAVGADRRRLAEPPAYRLAGFWSTHTVTHGARHDFDEKGFMAFTLNSGFSLREGTRIAQPFSFHLRNHKDELWIDLFDQNGERQFGICELSDDNSTARFCFYYFADGRATDERPKRFEDADSKGRIIVTLKRLGDAKNASPAAHARSSLPAPLTVPPIPSGKRLSIPQISGPPPLAVDFAFPVRPDEAPTQPSLSPEHPRVTLPKNPLRGAWTAVVNEAGPDHDKTQKMFAFFGEVFGLLSDFEGKAPMRFRLLVAKLRGQWIIDLLPPTDPRDGETLYGIFELSENKAYICFCGDQYHTINGRPKSFKEADPKVFTKITLTRVSTSSKSFESTERNIEKQFGVGVNSDASVKGTVVVDERNSSVVREDPAGRESKEKVANLKKVEGVLHDKLVVGNVNGAKILLEDVLHPVAKNLAQAREHLPPNDFRRMQENLLRKELPKHVDRLLVVHALRAKFTAEQWAACQRQLDLAFEKEIERLKNQFDVQSHDELKDKLIRHGTTLKLVRNSYEQRILAQQYLRNKTKNGEKQLDKAAFAKLISELRKKLPVKTVFDDTNGK